MSFAGYLLNMLVLKNNILANFLFTVLMETETLCRRAVMSIMSGVMLLLPISKKNDNSEGSVQNTV